MKRDFYIVTFETKPSKRTCSGTSFFRLMTAPVGVTHKERMAEFQEELGDMFDIISYDIDAEVPNVFHDTYWDRALQGAV